MGWSASACSRAFHSFEEAEGDLDGLGVVDRQGEGRGEEVGFC